MSNLVVGSLGDVAQKGNQSLAESFIGADIVLLFDSSGSMESRDSRGGLSRYDVALQELTDLQQALPGKIAIIVFSSTVVFVPHGLPPLLGGATDLTAALEFAKIADVADMRFIVISDGQPNNEITALNAARTYVNRIDTIFVGPEKDMMGHAFLRQLASASGGQAITADRAKELSSSVQFLLAKG